MQFSDATKSDDPIRGADHGDHRIDAWVQHRLMHESNEQRRDMALGQNDGIQTAIRQP